MSIRARVEAKIRRRLSVPVLVSDPSQDQANLEAVVIALRAAQGRDDDEAAAQLLPEVEVQAAKVQSHWASVELQNLHPDEWQAASILWQTLETTEHGPEMVTNWHEALPSLIAQSCVDPDLQDEGWWAEQLAKPEWSTGDFDGFRIAILRLNTYSVDPQVPKD